MSGFLCDECELSISVADGLLGCARCGSVWGIERHEIDPLWYRAVVDSYEDPPEPTEERVWLCPSALPVGWIDNAVPAREAAAARAIAAGESLGLAVAFMLDLAATRDDLDGARALLAHGDGRVVISCTKLLFDAKATHVRFGPAVTERLASWRVVLVDEIAAALRRVSNLDGARAVGELEPDALAVARYAPAATVEAMMRAVPPGTKSACAICARLPARAGDPVDEEAARALVWWATSKRSSTAERWIEEGLARCMRCGTFYRSESWSTSTGQGQRLWPASPSEIEAVPRR